MKTLRLFRSLVGVLSMVGALSSSSGVTNLHTFTYHQLTQFANPGVHGYGRSLALSADGRKIAFARPMLTNPATNLIYSVNFDGSGLTVADAWQGSGYANVDCNADGSQVISWESGILRIASGGGGGRQLIQIHGGFPDFRISADGSKVFVSMDRPFSTTPDTGPREPGIYVINTSALSLQEITGLTAFAAFWGTTEAQLAPGGFLPGWNGGYPYGISGDGSRIVCYVWTPTGYRLLAVSGGGLRELPLGSSSINTFMLVGLSGDGSRAFYYFTYSPCCSSGEELGVLNWDGSNRRVLLSTYTSNQSSRGWGTQRITLNGTGSKLIFGATGWLFNTDSNEQIDLGWNARFASTWLLSDGLKNGGLMDASGRRFIFLTTLANTTVNQLATAEIDTPSSGLAPTVMDPSCTPPYFVIGSNAPAFAFKPSPTNSLVPGGGAQAGFLYKDILDTVSWQGSTLHDNGVYGDPVAGDGIYSDNTAYFFSPPPLGYRMLRFKAEILRPDGLYHSYAVDMGPCFILEATPGGSGLVISSITPPNAPPGASVTISGSGFDPVATNNYVLFGSQPAQVVSVNPAGSQLVVTVPIDSPLGAVPVTVSSLGQTSAAYTVNVPDPLSALLGISQLTGLEIWGTVSQMYRIERTTNLQTSNSWIPLTNLFLSTRPTSWFDQTSTNQAKGFYRAIRVP